MKLSDLYEAVTYYNKNRIEVTVIISMRMRPRPRADRISKVHRAVIGAVPNIVDTHGPLDNWESKTHDSNIAYVRFYPVSLGAHDATFNALNINLRAFRMRALPARIREPAAV